MTRDNPAPTRRPWWADDLIHATMFLTRLPMPALARAERPLMRAGWAFPLVGILVGALGGGTLWASAGLGLPLLAAALLALLVTAIVTGGLHEDGLADIADGFGGGATRERKIEIMRDSRVGSYGVLALIIATGLKAAALANIAIHSPWLAGCSLAAAHVLGRSVILPIAYMLPPATARGLGTSAGRPKAVTTGLCLVLGILISLALLPGPGLLAGLAAATVAAGITGWLARRQIGGYTGDVLGGSEQVAECLTLLALSILPAGAAGFGWPT